VTRLAFVLAAASGVVVPLAAAKLGLWLMMRRNNAKREADQRAQLAWLAGDRSGLPPGRPDYWP
jgi:hypothetical protein